MLLFFPIQYMLTLLLLGMPLLSLKSNPYVRFLRINYAKELLTGTDMNIVDISLESGFGCLRSFNRVFKEETGMTPLKYRKNSA